MNIRFVNNKIKVLKNKSYTDDQGRLNKNSLEIYLNAMTTNTVDDLPDELYELVQENTNLLVQVLDRFEKQNAETTGTISGESIVTHIDSPEPTVDDSKIREYLENNFEIKPHRGMERMKASSNTLGSEKKFNLLRPQQDELFINAIKFKFKSELEAPIQIGIFNSKADSAILNIEIPPDLEEFTYVPRQQELPSGQYYCQTALVTEKTQSIVERFYYCTNEDKFEMLNTQRKA